MNTRPELTSRLDGKTFQSFYYLKEELVRFCKAQGLPTAGGKLELTDRIAQYLDTGRVLAPQAVRRSASNTGGLTLDTRIEENFVCSQRHRDFFKAHLGKGFSFNVPFQTWLKANAGKTYADAIGAYRQILEEKKQGKTTIDRQFEYNTYIRDFFAENTGKSLEQAIRCWNYKKGLQGHNRYEKSDLAALDQ